jgi:CRISPR-associated endonuclease/helicase Cas3
MSSTAAESSNRSRDWLRKALALGEDDDPFPWQQELFTRFARGTIERSLDIPTGLGKTAVMALWLVARACGAVLPRRLVYVVDRRAVVDQATDVARRLRECVEHDEVLKQSLGLAADRSLPISTLRGQHVDNREWVEDPASSAIIVGTVDMVGSRLFFSGYGTTRKMRPYHAGLLGADTLVVLDEAHLVPPFEKLLEVVEQGSTKFGPKDEGLRNLVPSFKIMSLSATGRTGPHAPFGLTQADLRPGTVTRKRLDASKRLAMHPLGDDQVLQDALAERAWALSGNGKDPVRCILFADKRKVAEATKKAIEKLAEGDAKSGVHAVEVDTELFVGGRRVFERESAARRLAGLGFIAGSSVTRKRPAFLVATSAGEVGVDLDADHMVCDLVAWERMVQRLGRVNRRGEGAAAVVVLREPEPVPTKAEKAALEKGVDERTDGQAKAAVKFQTRLRRWGGLPRPFEHLPLLDDNTRDASPGALRNLRLEGGPDILMVLEAATTPSPLRPALTRPLVDTWSMTSLKEHTGRPELGPWLRGWIEDDPPQTAVAWRTHLPVRTNGPSVKDQEVEAFFEAAPPHQSELLETETYRVLSWLIARARALLEASHNGSELPSQTAPEDENAPSGHDLHLNADDVAAISLSSSGDLRKTLTLNQLVCDDADAQVRKARQEKLQWTLAGGTLVVDYRLGGLSAGLLDDNAGERPRTVDDGIPWMPLAPEPASSAALTTPPPVVRFRVRSLEGTELVARDAQWRERLRFAAELSVDGEVSRWLVVQKWRHDAATEEDRSAGRPQLLTEHQQWVKERVRALADRLNLPKPYAEMLEIAARLHDEGKKATRWQRAFNAAEDGIYAKTRGPLNTALLDGYRHEFGSLPFAAKDPELGELPDDLRELALHLIAAHHGFARPIIGIAGCEDAPPSGLEERAREVALRFARLQKRWGPWGLAWWEALLRAADQQASRDNDAADFAPPKDAI